jgi:hypothetical protein
MRKKSAGFALALFIAIATAASAQTSDTLDTNNPRQLAARCAYTPSEDGCNNLGRSDQNTDAHQMAQAQFPGGGQRFGSPRMPRPYGRPPNAYTAYDDGHHTAIGGLIGFGAGFALGAGVNHNSSSRVGSGLIAGALGAVFGAAIGHSIATFPHAAFRRHKWSHEEDWALVKPSHQETPRPSNLEN